tara:strand:+ start:711 stop:1028 length:318 start_codon:yes stop_codon:yes gene_type:complete
MTDNFLAFYFFGILISIACFLATYNIYLPNIGLQTNPNKPNSAGLKPLANPITIIDKYLQTEQLEGGTVKILRRLKNWYTVNLALLFAGTPIITIIQIAISNSAN